MLHLNFTPFPVLTTERLILRQPEDKDANDLFNLRCDERVNTFIDRKAPLTIEDVEHFIKTLNKGIKENEMLYWIIILKEEQKLAGTICLWHISAENEKAEIGYELHPDWQGKGIMQEALCGVLAYGFNELKVNSIEAFTHIDNNRSIKLLEKNNFKRNAEMEKTHNSKEGSVATAIYTLYKGSYMYQ